MTTTTTKQAVPPLSHETAVADFLNEVGEKSYRMQQIITALYREFPTTIEEMTTLPDSLRAQLAERFALYSISPYREIASEDGQTTKILFKTHDGLLFETVLMKHLTNRITVCVSSQAGCAVGCTFCATGKLGLKRNLHYYEIADQVRYCNDLLSKEERRVRNVVFMGMGEPLHNYNQVKKAVEIMMDHKKMGIGQRHITISTCGIIAGIRKMMEDRLLVNLAISLHAPNDKIRTDIMPINTTNTLADLIDILDTYVETTNKRIFYEYIMLEGVNDHDQEAHELGKLLKGKLAHVNLIPFNSPEKNNDREYKRSAKERMRRFQAILQEYHIPSTIRVSLGQDIAAACGQLALETKE